MTFDLEKAREAVHILENFAFASGKITTGQIQDILWGARQLAGASTEIEQLREANTNFACQACDQAQEIERQATRIQELLAELTSANVELMAAGEIVMAKDARIQELEDALVEEREWFLALWMGGTGRTCMS